MSERLRKAREAYEKGDAEGTREAHSKEAMAGEEHKLEQGRYLGDMVYGAIDGVVTTFAVVSGVEGASLSTGVLLILGFANLLADGLNIHPGQLFTLAVALTLVTLFAVGSARSLIITKPWYTAGLEMLVLGGLTAIVSYYIGNILSGLVGA